MSAVPITIRQLRGPRVIGRIVTPDGVEMCIVQRWNIVEDPFFSTMFVYRKLGGAWKGFYYHHEDDFWGRSDVTLDTNLHTAVFYRTNTPAVTFDYVKETYIMHRWKRTSSEPAIMEARWWPR
jgi:hypothetical protein